MPVNITEDFVRYLLEQNASLSNQVTELTATVRELNQTIRELKEQLGKNSKNSSKPPSSDGLKKPAVKKDRSLRESSGKKQGAQEGHNGTHLSVTISPNHFQNHMHSDCEGCPYRNSCLDKACIKETIRMIRLGVTGCASHPDAAKLLNSKEYGGRSETIIATYFSLYPICGNLSNDPKVCMVTKLATVVRFAIS